MGFPTDDSANPDYDILDAIRPGMATIPNVMLLCASSPYVTVLMYLLPPILRQLKTDHPQLEINLKAGLTATTLQMLKTNALDLGRCAMLRLVKFATKYSGAVFRRSCPPGPEYLDA